MAFPRLTVSGLGIDDFAAGLVEAEGVLILPSLASASRAITSGSASAGRTCPRRSPGLESYAARPACPAAGLSGFAADASALERGELVEEAGGDPRRVAG